ncbi:MAG: restriction endonuclease [Planctomycetota bacterium]
MNSQIGDVSIAYTARGLRRYEVEVTHTGLHKMQVVRGDNRQVVVQKASLKAKQWDESWARKVATANQRATRKQQARDKEQKKALAVERTAAAVEALAELEAILAYTLDVDDAIDWESLKSRDDFPEPPPTSPVPPPELPEPMLPPRPRGNDPRYRPDITLFDKLIASRKEKKVRDAQRRFARDEENWSREVAELNGEHALKVASREQSIQRDREVYVSAISAWERARVEFEEQRVCEAQAIDQRRAQYEGLDPGAIVDYCELVLTRSSYPDWMPQTFDVDLSPATGILIVDYELPPKESLPSTCEVKYVISRDEFTQKRLAAAKHNKLYDSVLYQIALRTIHELFEADRVDALTAIVFNGFVEGVDPSSGQPVRPCVMSLQAGKEEFVAINLANVEPKACFKKLKGIASAALHSMTPIPPILEMDREDRRFAPSQAVVDGIAEGDNLAVMDWEDFEHLVREVFEAEFSQHGGDVRVTRASRDGGIDAVVFDPDPIRGGKIVIQAKRYTNTVDVSAVRDLYGTLMNEGANKGILVTTSDYGPDAYEFARAKPLTLLNGNNLLHLLEKHGHRARIDIKEAKESSGPGS